MKDYSLNQHLDKLKIGQNILAIQALNKGASGSDFLFSCQLEGVTDQLAPRNDPPENLNDLNRGINGSFINILFQFPIRPTVILLRMRPSAMRIRNQYFSITFILRDIL